jgi:hypothetical protein
LSRSRPRSLATAGDVLGGIVKDNDDTHVYPIAANTSIGGGGFLALEVDPTFGLGASDSARLFTSRAPRWSRSRHAAAGRATTPPRRSAGRYKYCYLGVKVGPSSSASSPCADGRRNRASRHVRRGACLPPVEARTNVGRAVAISG